jgi:3-oxoacid CoA-transferase
LAEKMRCGGAGIPSFYTQTGVGTSVGNGGIPIKFGSHGLPEILSKKKESKIYDGLEYILETSVLGDFSLIKAWKADENGNVVFRKSARNFNPDAAVAGRICIVEVEEIVPVGAIDPDDVHLPSIYVNRFFKGIFEKRIEFLRT